MDSSKGPCPHQRVPVETDESMTSSSLDLNWPPACKQCSSPTETSPQKQGYGQAGGPAHSDGPWGLLGGRHQQDPGAACRVAPQPCCVTPARPGQTTSLFPAGAWLHGIREQALLYECGPVGDHSGGFAGTSEWPHGHSVQEAEFLERPFSLKSEGNCTHYVPPQYPAACPNPMQGSRVRQCACCPPANVPRHNDNYHYQQLTPHGQLQPKYTPNTRYGSVPQHVGPPREVMHEVDVCRSLQAAPAPTTREIRRTISLSEEYRNIFITYSVDTAAEILPFTKFLTDQGFNPAIDIFDNPIRRMGINKWMDRFLNDKSVLIIVVISPKYREDVEGHGDDEHGLHTKYIYNQIQNEFIQQGCLNFRLVPVLFPNAFKRHVPNWLQSTRIYHWPRDTQDLLLRLLREERYIIPQRGPSLTLTVRPL
ncbi:E3 ubiquitin ligase TRAF3IP2 isoform X2 [Clinocottus analis]|uniref:E3 ubiquitin ligase TRAF3IP2 isoform X2 n=1 Tax=Clinocottus analis TaxID=304258 RepID=UPI0035C14A95